MIRTCSLRQRKSTTRLSICGTIVHTSCRKGQVTVSSPWISYGHLKEESALADLVRWCGRMTEIIRVDEHDTYCEDSNEEDAAQNALILERYPDFQQKWEWYGHDEHIRRNVQHRVCDKMVKHCRALCCIQVSERLVLGQHTNCY